MAGAQREPGPLEAEAAARLLSEQVEGLGLTPAERAEVLCLALGVPSEASAAARGISARAIRARRRQILKKLSAAAREPLPAQATPPGDGQHPEREPGSGRSSVPAGWRPRRAGAGLRRARSSGWRPRP